MFFFFFKGVVQTIQQEFDYNGESNLDLQYAMNLVNLVGSKQDVILYQVGDIPQGLRHFFLASFRGNELNANSLLIIGASFNNFLDASDGAYCSFEGGDDPTQDASYPDTYPNGYHSESRTCLNMLCFNVTTFLLRKTLPIVELQSPPMSFRLRMGIMRQIFHPSILLDNALSNKAYPLLIHNNCLLIYSSDMRNWD